MTSFTSDSFTSTSFTTEVVISPTQGGAGAGRRRNKWRDYIARLARDIKRIFYRPPKKIEEEEEEIEIVIPPAQPPKTVTILADPPTTNTKLETLNDKWSVVASSPPPQKEPEPIYPLILNPLTSPIIQEKVTLPRATKQSFIASYRVGEGSHIESQPIGMKLPCRMSQSKAAAIIQRLLILSEIERQV